jgi:NitT/TauT family transport system substrate-binding protein
MSDTPNLLRRQLLVRCAGALAAFVASPGLSLADEGQVETRKIRFVHAPSICTAPIYLAEELLRSEGIHEVEYLPLGTRNGPLAVGEGRGDFVMWDTPGLIPHLDAGQPIVLLAGVHGGCYELFAHERVRSIRDLKGKSVAIWFVGGGDYILLSSMFAYVGVDPRQDVKWLTGGNTRNAMELFVSGRADAFLGFGQEPEELKERKVGHVIVNTAEDRPWSQYYCCMLAANREFVHRNPVTTKRVVRAILKSADLCAAEPQRAARFLADKLYEPRYRIGFNVVKGLPYNRWRDSDPEATLRFHALRLHETGLIKTEPNQLVARCTDWRFLNELKKELKA